jgi:hypothetical protein
MTVNEDKAHMNGISTLLKETLESSLTPSSEKMQQDEVI